MREDGGTRVMERGELSDRDVRKVQRFIAEHYQEMYLMWSAFGGGEFFRGE